MAQLVGDAYVRIFADTHALRRAIDRDVKKIGVDAGDSLANSLLTNFGKTIEKQADARLRRYQITLADSIAGGDFNRMLRQSGKGIDEFVASIRSDLESFERRGYFKKVAGNAYDFRQALESLDTWAKQARLAEELRKTEQATRDLARAQEAQNRAWVTYGRNLIATQQRVDDHEISLRRYANTIDRTVILLNRHGDATGRMFGAGSRSELLNFIGRLMAGLSRIPAIAIDAFGTVFKGVTGVVEQFQDLQQEGMGVMAAIRAIGSRLVAGLVPSLLSAVAGIAAMTQLIPVVITLFAHLAGAITAVAGAIGIGLLGGLLALLPLLPAVGTGIGAIVLAIAGLSDRSDELKRRLAPVIDAFKDLKKVLADDFMRTLVRNARGVGEIIRDWTPTFRGVTRQIGFMVDRFVTLFRHPAMKPFIDAWQRSIPKIISSLGDGVVSLGAALTAFFRPILPYAERLAAAFDRAMRTFLDWTTSAKGQNAIADFMQTAWGYGKQLWGILKNVGSILGSILSAGAAGPGKDFLGWLEDITSKWAEFLDTPEGQAAIKQFFSDVGETMRGIRDFIAEFVEKLKTADWEQAKRDLESIISGATIAAKAISYVFTEIDRITRDARGALSGFGNPFEDFPQFLGALVEDFEGDTNELFTKVGEKMTALGDLVNNALETIFIQIPSRITEWLAGIDVRLLAPFINVIPLLVVAGGQILSAIGGFVTQIPTFVANGLIAVGAIIVAPFRNAIPALAAVLSNLVVSTVAFFQRIPGMIGAALVTIGVSIVAPFSRALGPLTTILGNIHNNVREIVSRIPGAIGQALLLVVTKFTSPFTASIPAVGRVIGTIVSNVRNWVSGIPNAVTGALAGLALRFTAPFAQAWSQIAGWIASIKQLVNSAVSWLSGIDLNPFSAPGPPGGPPSGPGGPGPRGGPGGGPMSAGPDPFGVGRLRAITDQMTSVKVREVQTGPRVVVTFEEGSIVVQSRATNEARVAQEVVDRIAAAIPV